MFRTAALAAVVASAFLFPGPPARGESRGEPYTEEELLERSTRVFVGEVLQTKTFPRDGRTVPTRARVLRSIKGKAEPGALTLRPKDPGLHVYFDEEFDPAGGSAIGIFYVGTEKRPDLLQGYRVIPFQRDPPPSSR